jgi:hypothetical protein
MISWSGDEMNLLALGCFIVANLVLCTAVGLAAIWWFRVGRAQLGLTGPGTPPPNRSESGWSGPELVLAERFARGDIDEPEYRRRLETLRTASGGPPTNVDPHPVCPVPHLD